MKSKIEYKRYLFTAAFICFFWLILSWPVLAAYQIEVGLPNIPGTSVSGSDPAAYIRYFFIFGLGLVGFLAVGAIVVGGIMYMTGGTVGKVEKARQIIWGAVTGVVLLLCSYLLLYTIDPTLVNLSPFKPPSPGNIPQTTTTPTATAAVFPCTGAGAIPNVSSAQCNSDCPLGVFNYDSTNRCCICYTSSGF